MPLKPTFGGGFDHFLTPFLPMTDRTETIINEDFSSYFEPEKPEKTAVLLQEKQLLPPVAKAVENQPINPEKRPKKPISAKKMGIRQMTQKVYNEVNGMSDDMKASLGDIEDAFDVITWGDSANGKTNFSLEMVVQICKALHCKAMYISWEEGHGKSFRDALLRQDVYNRIGNSMEIMDGGTFAEIKAMINRRKSAKVWVFDSIQASGITQREYFDLKHSFVLSRKKKIFIVVSWAQGKQPKGATAEAIKFYANIKIRVEKFIAFPAGRYGGNKNFIIWEEGAKKAWGLRAYNKHKQK